MERLTVYRTPILTLDPNAKAGGGMVEVVKLADHQQTVERLERENKRLFDDWKACRDALKGNINDPDPLPCTDERSLTLYGMVAGVLRSRDDLKQQAAQLREENKSLMACQCDGCAETLEDNDAYCQKCWAGLQTAHTTLRGLLVQMVTWAEDVTKDWVVDDDRELAADLQLIQACKAATLPREGGAQEEPTKKCLPNCPYCNDPFYGHKGHR